MRASECPAGIATTRVLRGAACSRGIDRSSSTFGGWALIEPGDVRTRMSANTYRTCTDRISHLARSWRTKSGATLRGGMVPDTAGSGCLSFHRGPCMVPHGRVLNQGAAASPSDPWSVRARPRRAVDRSSLGTCRSRRCVEFGCHNISPLPGRRVAITGQRLGVQVAGAWVAKCRQERLTAWPTNRALSRIWGVPVKRDGGAQQRR